MAWTITRNNSVMGNKRVNLIKILTDGTEANLETGMSVVEGFSLGIKSMATMTFTMEENENSSGTAANGYIGISGVTSGDEFHLVVYGR